MDVDVDKYDVDRVSDTSTERPEEEVPDEIEVKVCIIFIHLY